MRFKKDLELKLRPARKEDLKEILTIERLSFPTPWQPSHFFAELYKENAHFWVLLKGEKIIGYTCFWIIQDEAHLANVAIHPSFRGKGYGSFLFIHFLRFLRRKGVKRVFLEVRERNKIAQRFYEKFGFKKDGIRKNYYQDTKEHAILMHKCL
ncbi:ribosomal protein S18-alanine N-acetyltransferase [Thermodesulfatator atlanticus]|uniref:ribosomal protein S18-alanine N-acetyltransferase n=1 Tax=Thermodesulfatator atlanticus TaxID=501497 RepID=UPI0003B52F0F|nr:ribosomal protein S18-alanine N-acetyltransferase [Thermodesulfatator atlanticus]